MGLTAFATAFLLSVTVFMAGMAHIAEARRITEHAETRELAEAREWSKYTGTVNGADMIDFITRHKDFCDIIVRNSDATYLLGFRDTPDYFWDTVFLFDVVLKGHGEREYTANLLYNDTAVIGIEYREVVL
jgi:hypothetical protein